MDCQADPCPWIALKEAGPSDETIAQSSELVKANQYKCEHAIVVLRDWLPAVQEWHSRQPVVEQPLRPPIRKGRRLVGEEERVTSWARLPTPLPVRCCTGCRDGEPAEFRVEIDGGRATNLCGSCLQDVDPETYDSTRCAHCAEPFTPETGTAWCSMCVGAICAASGLPTFDKRETNCAPCYCAHIA